MTVLVPVRLTQEQMKNFKALTATAIRQAIETTIMLLKHMMPTVTPRFTGRLQESFKIRPLPYGTGVMFSWSAVDPISKFDYAKVADTGRPGGRILAPKRAKAMAFPVPWQAGSAGPKRYLKRAIQGAVAGKKYSAFMAEFARRALIGQLEQQFIIHLQGG
jgi:hypothetical protein